jgi:D-beta-D-heptose 7-phosphate kinase/D-beta-D-heptose 1-phosphate adenosyltransferase
MAANVRNNIKALGAECNLYTNNDKPVKTRYVEEESNQTLLRVDEWDEIRYMFNIDILNSIHYMEHDAIVISDYNKGYLREDDIAFISNRHPLVFLDSKKKLGNWCKNISIIKINEKEYFENSAWLKNYHGKLVITLGSRGTEFEDVIYPIHEQHPVRDLTGAGDTYLAALVVEYLKTEDIRKSIQFANKCAAWVVTQKGVTIIDLNKIK